MSIYISSLSPMSDSNIRKIRESIGTNNYLDAVQIIHSRFGISGSLIDVGKFIVWYKRVNENSTTVKQTEGKLIVSFSYINIARHGDALHDAICDEYLHKIRRINKIDWKKHGRG